MARVALSSGIQTIPATGLNLTDMTTDNMATGAGNGVEVPYQQGTYLLLRNDTAGSAAYTIKVPTPAGMSARGITVPDVTVNVSASKDVLYPVDALFRQAGDLVYVDCDVAANIGCIKA